MIPVIFGCSGTTLTKQETEFFAKAEPLGFILFARNCESKEQVTALVKELHEVTKREFLPILIDQEGGRVARLKAPEWPEFLPAADFAKAYQKDKEAAIRAAWLNARLIAGELRELGITVNCAPVADLPAENAHAIIGDRAYGNNPEQIVALARATEEGLRAGGVLPVIKHIPGHGRAENDSHEALPVVKTELADLEKTDFAVFRQFPNVALGMTAHVVFTALDAENPVTLSEKAIHYIRYDMGFGGMIMSDDLSMKALSGSMADRAKAALAAGCDILLHCNGDMKEMKEIAECCPNVKPEVSARIDLLLTSHEEVTAFDAEEGWREHNELMAA